VVVLEHDHLVAAVLVDSFTWLVVQLFVVLFLLSDARERQFFGLHLDFGVVETVRVLCKLNHFLSVDVFVLFAPVVYLVV